MTDPTVLAADVAAGAALLVAGATSVTTWLTWRGQRKNADQQRRHERHMRLLDSTLTTAVDFLAAADRTARASQGLSTAYISLQGAKSTQDDETYQRFLAMFEESRASVSAAAADAENAYSAIRMLIPDVAYPARKYLDFCLAAEAHPDETKVDRERARQMTEQAIRKALGGDLPDDWMFAEPPVPQRRWWKVLRRRSERRAVTGAPRQP